LPDVTPPVPAAEAPAVDAPDEDAAVDAPDEDAPTPASDATPEEAPTSPAPTEDLPAPPAPAPPSPPAPSVAPAPMSAGFSANGRRRVRRGRSPVSGSHDRSNGTPRTEAPLHGPNGSRPGAPASPPAVSDGPVATGAVSGPEPPQPGEPEARAELPAQPTADAPPLPRRERGATTGDVDAAADEEALDLFGELDDGAGRSTLGDFQRGQESARRETRR
jgi:hypothetical protein